MLSVGEYIKLILKKRGLTVKQLAQMMTEAGLESGKTTLVYSQHLCSEFNNNILTIERARGIEVVLGLPRFQLVNMINPNLNKQQIERLDNIYKKKV